MNSSITATAPSATNWWLPTWTLTRREIVRFLRQRSRVVTAIGTPLFFWILFGAGLSGSFQMSGNNDLSYQEYFLPGAAVMIVLFSSIFAAISVIQDRHEGFLQGVLASPVPRSSIVMGKVLGGTVLAMVQAVVFILAAPALQFVGLAPQMSWSLGLGNLLGAIAFLGMVSLALNGLGYFFAWKIDSIQGYHGVMNLVLLPMWLLSGAFFPASGSPWLRVVTQINPLTYGVAGLRHCISNGADAAQLPPMWLCVAVILIFGIACVAADVWITRRQQNA